MSAGLERFRDLGVVVIGDAILDSYFEGRAERVCREAPVPVVHLDHTSVAPGGAANVAGNFAALGANVRYIGVVGDDEGGAQLAAALAAAGVDVGALVADPRRKTVVKRRLLCDGAMVARFDDGSTDELSSATNAQVARVIRSALRDADIAVLSDYRAGLFDPGLVADAGQARPRHNEGVSSRSGQLLGVDSPRLALFRSLAPDVVKPSIGEAAEQLGKAELLLSTEDRLALGRSLGPELLELSGAAVVALTLDGDGAWLLRRGAGAIRLATHRIENQHAAGAGDTFLSALLLAIASGADLAEAGHIATVAAGVVVERPNTSVCSLGDLRSALSAGAKHVATFEELTRLGERYRAERKRVVLTNGCFDILHPGHVRLLEQAKALGDVLVVAVNSDESIRALKGETRPINSLENRLSVIAGLASVDHTFAFGTQTASPVVEALRPAVYAKGGDYSPEDLPEAAAVRECGGRIEILPLFGDESTSRVIARVLETTLERMR
ncbi:MAG: PfkB family carbohydrate kinase [Coriobacteriia bacterium]